MSWAEDDSYLINVFGEPEAVIPLAQVIAEFQGGHLKVITDE
jgi:hypothetical protein